ncbi:heavy metal translocating P-type ATPase [Hyalangium sp.]|uniref:heavy metal translocating P-type ATPase n=1 Tax=Hyalangium sp. TaxID=2028555 RepID=UPI002D44442F|nr:heavy metal translocating P-type ATPase [Hyalangium sp.]HYI00972.1 heavy metal translocating P-type ATPase [Hyalangium sp.]
MMLETPRLGPEDVVIRSMTPGRLRLGLSEHALGQVSGKVQELVTVGVARSVELNPLTGSVLFAYDANRLSERDFLDQTLDHCGLSLEDRARVALGFSLHAPATAAAPRPLDPAEVENWQVRSSTPGRLRLWHPFIERYEAVATGIDACLRDLGGVSSYSLNPATSTVLVRYDEAFLPQSELQEALREAVRGVVASVSLDKLVQTPVELDAVQLRLSTSTMTMLVAGVSLLVPGLGTMVTLGALAAASHILLSAARSLFIERKLRVDVLDATVITLALLYRRSVPATFMIWVVDISNLLLDASSKESRRRLTEVFGRQVRKTWLLTDGKEVEVKVADLQRGNTIVVRAGEQIPIDGEISVGGARVDQSALTGEYAPAEKTVGERVFAMSVVLSGELQIRVNETGKDTNASRMVQIIEQSLEHKVQVQSVTERFADGMVLPTLGIGGLGYAVAGPNAMMAIVNADFGTGIRIAGPLAMLTSLSAAARNGILVKKGAALESFSKLDAVILDKTGTLTQEIPLVARLLPLDPAITEDVLLYYVACAEQRFKHPIAKAILQEAARRGVKLQPVAGSDYNVGFGIKARIDGHIIRVGSQRYLESEGIRLSALALRYLEESNARGGSAVLAAADAHAIGLLELQATPRPEALHLVQALQRRGIKETYLISGDHEAPTRALAEQLGIERYFAGVLPQEKANYVRQLQERGLRVAMVGDGINDTVGLSQADCSISLRGAADAAVDIADIVLLDGNLGKIELLFEISDNLNRNIRRSLGLALVPNSLCIAGALAGFFGLGTSLILNNVFNMVAVGNGLRAQSSLEKPHKSLVRQ